MSDQVVELGRVSIVPAREVWPHEAHNFTPWLLGNVDVLSDLLGMDLVLETAEHPVGDFSLDLIGRDLATDQRVIVENQLEISDHTHLGQLLTYAAGTDPTTIVWVATSFRPEHRAALDWLNDRTTPETRFFGVEIQVIRIGDSAPAPAFKLLAQPNDWNKQVKASAAVATGEPSEREKLYWDFWEKFRTRVRTEHPTWTKSAASTRASWFRTSAGVRGGSWTYAITTSGLAVHLVFEDVDRDLNHARFDKLLTHKDLFEEVVGAPLEWDGREEVKSAKVTRYTGGTEAVTDVDQWDAYVDWLITTGVKMREAFAAVGGAVAVEVD